jgi:hypothetical protein
MCISYYITTLNGGTNTQVVYDLPKTAGKIDIGAADVSLDDFHCVL